MERFFNTAGPCNPEDHYMLPPEDRIPGIRRLIDSKLYFVIHAPRQVGKTTAFATLAKRLTEEGRYAALHASCETAQAAGGDVDAGVTSVLNSIRREARLQIEDQRLRPPEADPSVSPQDRLNDLLTRWAETCLRQVVLFLDEIDALLDQTLISVLRQLRSGYPSRPGGFPQSIALIGLRDVRDYKVRMRPESNSLGTASPFNIKVKSITLRNFNREEVARLYGQHTKETGQLFTEDAVELAYELTMGQPYLVNALAFETTWEKVIDRSIPITARHIEEAKEAIIEKRETHLDSLIDRLREERIKRVIAPIMAGEEFSFDVLEDDIRYVEDLGLITTKGNIEIANPIYREIIPRALSWTTQVRIWHESAWYTGESGRLDMDRLMEGFLEFWMEHSEALLLHQPYPEAAPHLVLLAFLQRIVNAGGYIDREYAVGMGRMDVLVRWPYEGGIQREALEIKVWRDKKGDPLDKGLSQLSGYLRRLGLKEGTLIIFDRRKDAPEVSERCSMEHTTFDSYDIRVVRA